MHQFCRRLLCYVVVAFALPYACGNAQAQTFGLDTVATLYNSTAGTYPNQLIQASDGNFYSTTNYGANGEGNGAVYQLTPAGAITVLHTFCAETPCTEGVNPAAGLVQATDGFLYGTTSYGGTMGQGTVFKISLAGAFTTLYNFCQTGGSNCTDGQNPSTPLIQGTDGYLYGYVSEGAANGNGGFFKISTSGSYSLLYSNTVAQGGAALVPGPLVQGTDGNFYDTYYSTGTQANGQVFQITPAGKFNVVYNFCQQGGSSCTDGTAPVNGLIQGADGDFYGTTSQGGGTDNCGTLFKVSSGGSFSTLYDFGSASSETDGCYPNSPPVLGSDGNYYGFTAEGGGVDQQGTFYEWNGSAFTSLYAVCQGHAGGGCYYQEPFSALQGLDGAIYTVSGNASTDYKLVDLAGLPAPVQLTLSSATVNAGSTFTLSYKVINATSNTMKQCFASNNGGVSAWTGVVTATPSEQTITLTAPSTAALYNFALTCGGVESNNINLDVDSGPAINTSTSLVVSPNPAAVGQLVTLKATVTPASGTVNPGGNVSFYYGSVLLATAGLNNGVATYTVPTSELPVGSYVLTAKYALTDQFNASSGTATAVIVANATSTTLTANPNPLTPPAAITFTATVKRTASGATGTPTGSVGFYIGTSLLDTATLSNGVATYKLPSTNGLPQGSYTLTAKYEGDSTDVASSGNVSVTVK